MNNVSFTGMSSLRFNSQMFQNARNTAFQTRRVLDKNNTSSLQSGAKFVAFPDENNCVVLVRGDKKGFLDYINVNGYDDFKLSKIARKVEELTKTSQEKLTAWIMGGDNFGGKSGDMSINMVNKLAEILSDRPDIDTSIMACNKIPLNEGVAIHPTNNFLELLIDKPKTNLENLFDIVELNNATIM